MNKLKPKYSLFTAVCLVVGIVVGTGVFFKAGNVLAEVNGNLMLSTLAWVIGGVIMVVSCYNFSTISLYKENTNSLMDFAKVTCGKGFESKAPIDLTGFTCLEQDTLFKDFPESVKVGDVIQFRKVGGYPVVYKPPFIQPNCAMIAVKEDGSVEEIKRRETFEDIFLTYKF